ncbi:MAG: BACON domain-containing protein, partial [Bryobacterales bacterium]|nr:BACON domain-containing protein [Bryobacterales bacterium]
MRILFGLLLLACSAASLTTIEVRTEGFGTITNETTGIQNLNGAMVWNGTTWVVNDTWAHKYFIDTRTGARLKSYTTRAYQGAAPSPDTFGTYTVQPIPYTYQKTAANGVYRFQAIEYRIRNQATGRQIVLRSRGTQTGAANAYFDIYIEDEVAAGAPPQTTALRGDPVWFTYPLSLEQALLQTSSTASRTGLLPTAGGDYYLDYGGGADLGPHGEGRSIQFQTATVPVADSALTLGSVFAITAQYKWMDDAGNLFEMRFLPYASGTFTPNATCTFTLSAHSTTLPATHSGTFLALTASAPTCAWTAATSASWLLLDTSGGTGSALLTLRAADNPSTSLRTATLTIGGQS